jgi:hypothetical protein
MSPEFVNLRQATRDVFSKPENREYGGDYAKEVRENWKEVSSSIGRSAVLLLVSIFAFELLARASIDKVTIAGLEIKDLSFIRRALPVLSAYLFYEIISLWARHVNFNDVHAELIRTLHPDIYDKDLEFFLTPRLPSATFMPQIVFGSSGRNKLYTVIGRSLALLVLLIVPVFEIYAYYLQFRFFPFNDPLLWVALFLTIVLLVYGLLVAVVATPASGLV